MSEQKQKQHQDGNFTRNGDPGDFRPVFDDLRPIGPFGQEVLSATKTSSSLPDETIMLASLVASATKHQRAMAAASALRA
jgi:hypothetical protein